MSNSERRSRHPANAPGPFYVGEGCCLLCGVPFDVAPENFRWIEDGAGQTTSCVVAKQPSSDAQLDLMLEVMRAGEVDCIRYDGLEPSTVRRLAEAGLGEQSDVSPPQDAREVVRERVSFASADDVGSLAGRFAAWFADPAVQHRASLTIGRSRADVELAWASGRSDRVGFRRGETPDRWLATCGARSWKHRRPHTRLLARSLDGWLRTEPLVSEIRWWSAAQYRAGGPWSPTIF